MKHILIAILASVSIVAVAAEPPKQQGSTSVKEAPAKKPSKLKQKVDSTPAKKIPKKKSKK